VMDTEWAAGGLKCDRFLTCNACPILNQFGVGKK